MLKVYLDNCCFNRPYDDQSYISIYLETQAKLLIQELVKDKALSLIWSFILDYENNNNPDPTIKKEIGFWRELSDTIIFNNNQLLLRAKEYTCLGIGNKDALHLSSALEANCDYFITVDKGILKKRERIDKLKICSPIDKLKICSPIELVEYLEKK